MQFTESSFSNGAACVQFAKSSFSYNGANCVEFGKSSFSIGNNACLEYGKSSFSGSNGGGCVEVSQAILDEAREEGVREEALDHDKVIDATLAGEKLFFLRDSKDPSGPVLVFTRSEWEAFTKGVANGEFLPE